MGSDKAKAPARTSFDDQIDSRGFPTRAAQYTASNTGGEDLRISHRTIQAPIPVGARVRTAPKAHGAAKRLCAAWRRARICRGMHLHTSWSLPGRSSAGRQGESRLEGDIPGDLSICQSGNTDMIGSAETGCRLASSIQHATRLPRFMMLI